jgi:hypothetical protein
MFFSLEKAKKPNAVKGLSPPEWTWIRAENDFPRLD